MVVHTAGPFGHTAKPMLEAGMGMHLLDNLYLADLEKACTELSTWEFMFVVSPLRIEKGTGSPINPIAIL